MARGRSCRLRRRLATRAGDPSDRSSPVFRHESDHTRYAYESAAPRPRRAELQARTTAISARSGEQPRVPPRAVDHRPAPGQRAADGQTRGDLNTVTMWMNDAGRRSSTVTYLTRSWHCTTVHGIVVAQPGWRAGGRPPGWACTPVPKEILHMTRFPRPAWVRCHRHGFGCARLPEPDHDGRRRHRAAGHTTGSTRATLHRPSGPIEPLESGDPPAAPKPLPETIPTEPMLASGENRPRTIQMRPSRRLMRRWTDPAPPSTEPVTTAPLTTTPAAAVDGAEPNSADCNVADCSVAEYSGGPNASNCAERGCPAVGDVGNAHAALGPPQLSSHLGGTVTAIPRWPGTIQFSGWPSSGYRLAYAPAGGT